MPDLYAEIQVNSLAAPLDAFTLSMDQSRGHTGAPNSVVRFRPIKVTITGLAAILAFFTEWAVDSYLRRSGRIVVYEGDRVKWVLSFYDARCTFYYTRFQPGETEQAAYQLTLEIAACAWEMDGLQIEIYSRIPWVKDFKTRWAALTPPAEILPSPSLRNLPAEVRPTPPQDPAPTASLQAQPSKRSAPQSSNSKPIKPYKNKKQYLGGDEPSKQESNRLQYLGRTPGKGSPTGQKVIKRMEAEGKIRKSEESATKEVLGPDGEWYDIHKTDMGHIEDAVNWWNTEGRKHPPKGKVVRTWMLDSNNYELEPSSINRSRGAKLKQTYLPPLE